MIQLLCLIRSTNHIKEYKYLQCKYHNVMTHELLFDIVCNVMKGHDYDWHQVRGELVPVLTKYHAIKTSICLINIQLIAFNM